MSNPVRYFHQVKWGAFFRAGAILSSFIVIPWLIRYLGKDGYGVWATMFSLASWIVIFDIGITSGLRNCVTTALASNKTDLAREYVSTAYFYFFMVCATVLFSFFFIFYLIDDFPHLLSVDGGNAIAASAAVLGGCVIAGFYLMLVHQLYNALHKSFYVAFYGFLVSFSFLCSVVLLSWLGIEKSLFSVACCYGVVVILSGIALNVMFFHCHPELQPSLSLVRFHRLKGLSSFGLRFFLIQLSALVIFSLDRVMVAVFVGAGAAAEYDIALKYIGVVAILQSVFIAPIWSYVGNKYALNDFNGVNLIIKRQIKVWLWLSFVAIVAGVLYKRVIGIWLGASFIDTGLMVICVIFSIQSMWLTIFSSAINGMGKIRVSVWMSVLSAFINIPLAYLVSVHLGYGSKGVLIAASIALMPGVILGPYQAYLIIQQKDRGIWAK